MNTKKIVITGGPSTGKTAVIEALQQKGYCCYEEVIRAMTLAQKEADDTIIFESNPIVSVDDPAAFNQMILNARIADYEASVKSSKRVVFFDRGIPDVLAYMDCFKQTYNASYREACSTNTYDYVFIMPPWKEIHINDSGRFESFEESLQINDCLMHSYTSFGYDVLIVPTDTIANRVDYILNHIKEHSD